MKTQLCYGLGPRPTGKMQDNSKSPYRTRVICSWVSARHATVGGSLTADMNNMKNIKLFNKITNNMKNIKLLHEKYKIMLLLFYKVL